ncbi:hypothetical protein [Micromonospora sp. NPDC051006]|uniref:hypothetical protein n=1 Tax=Micromonospora sp. NPDC051006 TaxID=3364283 RepID=UPI0037A92AD8
MLRTRVRIGAGLVASTVMAVGLGVAASPASAQPSGLTFYSTSFTVEVLHVDSPTGECTSLPATASGHVGWSGFTDVVLYRSTDCSGYATSTGTLRTYRAGEFASFRAY